MPPYVIRAFTPAAILALTLASACSRESDLPTRSAESVTDEAAGGILLGADPDNRGDQQPERVQIQFDGTLYPGNVPSVTVGDRLGGVTGVVGYNFGNFEVNATEVVQVFPSGLAAETAKLTSGRRELTIASYNVLNMSADVSDDVQRALLAAQIVVRLASPDILALQEIQDNNGEQGGAGNTETDASQTLGKLATAIAAAGGPAYTFADVAPAANTSGGVPGGNIRVSFLYRSGRVTLVQLESVTPAVLTAIGSPDANAFTDSRNPLAGTFDFGGQRLTIVTNHFSSRSGSTPIFGAFSRSCRWPRRPARPRHAPCTTTSPTCFERTRRPEWSSPAISTPSSSPTICATCFRARTGSSPTCWACSRTTTAIPSSSTAPPSSWITSSPPRASWRARSSRSCT
jgi:hypothetical protein